MVFLMKWLIKSNLTFLFEIPTLNLPNKINFTVYVTLTFCPPSEISIQYRYTVPKAISRLEIFHNTPRKYPRYSFKNVCAMHFEIYYY